MRLPAIAAALLLAIGFLKLPATTFRSDSPQSWEAVLAYAASNHLQWGKDIVFTYGPLGFLSSDYYWGYFFWPLILWAVWFSIIMTLAFLRLSKKIHPAFRAVLILTLPLATSPLISHLGFDPICILAITALSISAFPEERPSLLQLLSWGVTFAILGQIKFTFFLYAVFSIAVVSLAQLLKRKWPEFTILVSSALVSFLGTWLLIGQSITGLPRYFHLSSELAGEYSAGMALAADRWDLAMGLVTALLMMGSLFYCWYPWRKSIDSTLRFCIVTAGMFLAWKEGFVRADVHVAVFFIFSFFMFLMLPAFLTPQEKPRWNPAPLVVAGLLVSASGLFPNNARFFHDAACDFFPKITEAFTALVSPSVYRSKLEGHLDSMRKKASLPTIVSTIGKASVGVFLWDQDMAILNRLNYRPCPVFQNYSAYTPALQRLNSNFFFSDKAPEYIIWRYRIIEPIFPTLYDGELLLEIPRLYSPVLREGQFSLWKRNPDREETSPLSEAQTFTGKFSQIMLVPDAPVWLKVEMKQTFFGLIRTFVYQAPEVFIDVHLKSGEAFRCNLIPGNAASGFLLNPLIGTESDLLDYSTHHANHKQIEAFRIETENPSCYNEEIRFSVQKIHARSLP